MKRLLEMLFGRPHPDPAERRAEAAQERSDVMLTRAGRVLDRVEKVLDDEDRLASYRSVRLRHR